MPDNDANHSRLAALQPLWIKVILMTRLQTATPWLFRVRVEIGL
jgi:hypothetical protein